MSTRSEINDNQWTFTQGLILGQASFLLLTLVFIRYVVFSPANKRDGEDWRKRRDERVKKAMLASSKVPPPPPSQILAKTNYEMATHPAEDAGWITVLFAQVMQGYRNDLLSAGGEEGARIKVEKWLNPENGSMSWLDPIRVTSISLGTSYPLFSNARIRPADGQGHLRAEIDMDYLDSVALSLSTAVLVNFPKPRFAVLPISLGVELAAIGGTLSMQIHDPVEGRQHLHACLLPDFHLNLKTTSLLGSRAKLQDIPKLEQLLLSRIRSVIQDRIVHPHTFAISLPRILSGTTVSSREFMADLGEEAKEVMSQAVRQGLGQIVNDLGLGGDSASTSEDNRAGTRAPSASGVSVSVNDGGHSGLPTPRLGIDTKVAAAPKANTSNGLLSPRSAGRKIHMPAGFPHSTASASASTNVTPLQTPGLRSLQQAQPHPESPSQPNGATSAYRHPLAQTPVRHEERPNGLVDGGGPAAGAEGRDGFRFRGQFSSQPPTPGVAGLDHGSGAPRRLGALNSRVS